MAGNVIKNTYFGGTTDASTVEGNIVNTLEDVTYGSYYGGNYYGLDPEKEQLGQKVGSVNGNITNNLTNVTITGNYTGGNGSNEVASGLTNGKNIGSVAGTITNNITSSNINGTFYAASLSGGPKSGYETGTIGAVTTNIKDSYVNWVCVSGGGLISKINGDVNLVLENSKVNELYHNSGAYVGGNVNITLIDTAVQTNYFYAGVGNYGGYGDYGIAGDINVSLEGTSSVAGNVNLGAPSSSTTTGNATLTLKDSAKVNGSIYGRTANKTFGGNVTLNFDSYTGNARNVSGFDKINVSADSSVKLDSIVANDFGKMATDVKGNLNVGSFVVENQVIEKATDGKYTSINAVYLKNSGTTKIDNLSFKNNTVKLEQTNLKQDGGNISGVFAYVTAGDLSVSGNISNNSFAATGESVGTTGAMPVYGALFYTSGDAEKSITVSNSTVSNNTSTSYYNVQGGVFALDGNGATTLKVENSTFSNNGTILTGTEYGVMGGVISSIASNKTIIFNDTTFDSNYAKAVASTARFTGGGVAYLGQANVTFNDVVFTNNYVDASYWTAGGAIFANNNTTLNFNVTKDAAFVGNYAKIDGEMSDEFGGFAMLHSNATANFDVAKDATLTIGDGIAGYDSIASRQSSVEINKLGAGTMTVNSSMEYYTGTLNVKEGTMNVNNGLGASAINISEGANLGLRVNGANTLSNADLTLSNNGTIILSAGSKLESNKGYAIAANSAITNFGNVKAYGGTFANGNFTVGAKTSTSTSALTSEAAKVASATTLTITDDTTGKAEEATLVKEVSIATESNAAEVSVNHAEAIDFTKDEFSSAGMDALALDNILTAWTFNVDGVTSDNTVVLSFMLGEGFDMNSISIWHRGDNGIWEDFSKLVDGKSYVDGVFSFIATGFSDYALTTVPEPSTYALIFGSLALAFVAYRRRK